MNKNFIKLLKTNGEKMSVFRLSTMLMKTRELSLYLHDVDETKGVMDSWCQMSGTGELGLRSEVRSLRGQDSSSGMRGSESGKEDSESRMPNPECRIPSPESRVPNAESRVPNAECRIPSPESRRIFPAVIN
jgi:hypothetical protein